MNFLSRVAFVVTLVIAMIAIYAPMVDAQRPMEKLGRGVVAVRASTANVLVSWRLLGLDPSGIGFNI